MLLVQFVQFVRRSISVGRCFCCCSRTAAHHCRKAQVNCLAMLSALIFAVPRWHSPGIANSPNLTNSLGFFGFQKNPALDAEGCPTNSFSRGSEKGLDLTPRNVFAKCNYAPHGVEETNTWFHISRFFPPNLVSHKKAL